MVKRRTEVIISILLLGSLLGACGSEGNVPDALSAQETAGERLFLQNCASCHATSSDVIIVGPALVGIAQEAGNKVPGLDARSYIEASILEPDAYINEGFNDLMPKTFGKTLTGEELDSLVAYLLTLE